MSVQQLYQYLDCTGPAGDRHLAWYGQCRAGGMTHEDAIRDAIRHFHLDTEEWWKRRALPPI